MNVHIYSLTYLYPGEISIEFIFKEGESGVFPKRYARTRSRVCDETGAADCCASVSEIAATFYD